MSAVAPPERACGVCGRWLIVFGFVPRSLAVVGIVGALIFGMPVAASADGWTDNLMQLGAVAAVGGGVGVEAAPAAAGSGFACAATLPVCLAVAAAVVGGALFLTRDTWLPWFQNGTDLSGALGLLGPGWVQGSGWKAALVDAAGDVVSGTSGVPYKIRGVYNRLGPNVPSYITPDASGLVQCRDSADVLQAAYQQTGFFYNPEGWWNGTGGPDKFGTGPGTSLGQWLCGGRIAGFDLAIGLEHLRWGTLYVAPPPAAVDLRTTVTCQNPDGSTYEVVAHTLDLGPVKVATCTGAAGSQAGARGKCLTLSRGLNGGPQVDQSSNCLSAAATAALYPDCAAGTVACTYVVRIDGVPCVVGGVCAGWASIYATDPARVQCRYGHYVVPVADCAFLERVYETGHIPATVENTDGNPATWTRPGPQGQPNDQPSTPSRPATGTEPPPLPVPTPGVGLTPSQADCWPSGWAMVMEPTSWVLMPITCALRWAFVPTVANLQTAQIQAELDRAGIAPSVEALSAVVGSLGGDSGGCSGPAVNFDIGSVHQVVTPFAACTEPMSTVAGYAYALTSVIVVVGGAGKIIASLGAGFGFGGPPPTWQQGTLF